MTVVVRMNDLITERFNSFLQFFFIAFLCGIEYYFSTHQINTHVLHALVAQVFIDGERTVRTGHSFHFPVHFLHFILIAVYTVKLQTPSPYSLPLQEL